MIGALKWTCDFYRHCWAFSSCFGACCSLGQVILSSLNNLYLFFLLKRIIYNSIFFLMNCLKSYQLLLFDFLDTFLEIQKVQMEKWNLKQGRLALVRL